MVPVLPIINQPPPYGLFLVIVFLPITFYALAWLTVHVTNVIISSTYVCYRRQIIIVRKNSKLYCLVLSCYDQLERLNVLIFPGLFTEKKVQSGAKEWKEVLFLDKRWPKYQGSKNPKTELMVLFASLGITIIFISALGFFRNFPVITGSECLERHNNFNNWYCYDYNATLSSEPLDCKNYVNSNESTASSMLECYAFSLDIGKSFAVAFGLYKFSSIVVLGIVFLRKSFYWICQKCKMPVACGVYCYSVTIFSILFITSLCLLIFIGLSNNSLLGTSEVAYLMALYAIPLTSAIYALRIPLLMHRYGVDSWPTYNCLATVDEEAEVELTPRIVANDRDNCDEYSAFEDKTS